jgi:hypothetical protein
MFLTISGATGFIGRRLLALYPPDQNSLVVLARKNPRLDPLIHYGHWDPVAGEPSRELLGRAEAVIHLAGEPVSQRWTPAVKAAIRDSRVLGTRHLVSAIGKLRHRPKTLVCASAVGIYGHRGEEVLTESAPPAAGFLPEVCTAWEAEADKAREHGLRVVKLRIGIVLGADGGALAAMAPLFRWGLGGGARQREAVDELDPRGRPGADDSVCRRKRSGLRGGERGGAASGDQRRVHPAVGRGAAPAGAAAGAGVWGEAGVWRDGADSVRLAARAAVGGAGGGFFLPLPGTAARFGRHFHLSACYPRGVMAIPNVKRFRITSPDGLNTATLMAVVPKGTDHDTFLKDASARFDWKAWNDQKASITKVRVGQQKQKKAK